MIQTEIVNKWWDGLTHEQKCLYIKEMDRFNWGDVVSVSAITKYQKNELYQQVHQLKPPRMKYQDLLYFGNGMWDEDSKEHESEFIKEINERFQSSVKLKNAYDSIKGYRQEVYILEKESDNYYAWIIANGWIEASLTLQLISRTPEKNDEFLKYINLAKQQYPNNFKNT